MEDKKKCYTDTFDFVLNGSKDMTKTKLEGMDYLYAVHGKVIGKNGKYIDHAWVEFGSKPFAWVWESQLRRMFNKDDYYKEVKAKPSYKLTPRELIKVAFNAKNYGPFTKSELAKIK